MQHLDAMLISYKLWVMTLPLMIALPPHRPLLSPRTFSTSVRVTAGRPRARSMEERKGMGSRPEPQMYMAMSGDCAHHRQRVDSWLQGGAGPGGKVHQGMQVDPLLA